MNKKILITGSNSYIGNSFVTFCNKNSIDFDIDTLSVRGEDWRTKDFSNYDTVINVAGIAHRKEIKENRELYYKVNKDLAVEIAKKAKNEHVKHFVFLSTMSVYGMTEGLITKETPCNPRNAYGKSKLDAEKLIHQLTNKIFTVAIIRPPMVYGPNCKGNYQVLSKFAKTTKIFPNIKNQRSMIFVDNLSMFLIEIIKRDLGGIFFPQNKEYVETKNLINAIAEIHNRHIYLTSIFNPFITKIKNSTLNKIFGDLVYDKKLSKEDFDYQIMDFNKSIEISERGQF